MVWGQSYGLGVEEVGKLKMENGMGIGASLNHG